MIVTTVLLLAVVVLQGQTLHQLPTEAVVAVDVVDGTRRANGAQDGATWQRYRTADHGGRHCENT